MTPQPRSSSPHRTIAIIAHVDHGKTTLLDHMLRQSGSLNERGEVVERVMDSDPQERERGITILSKCTAVSWQGQQIQIVDTPGHQDFGGEVERMLRMVDSVLLLVDAVEGPMPQTRFVLRKALEHGHRPVVVINKMDRPQARPDWVVNSVFDLFSALGADDEQLDFPVVYASGREGWASPDDATVGQDLRPLFQTIVDHVEPRVGPADGPLQLQVATLDYSEYLGRIAIGRVTQGSIQRGLHALCCRASGAQDPFRVTKLMGFSGLRRVDRERAEVGEVIALAGVDQVTVGDTICDEACPAPLPPIPIDEPTIVVLFGASDSPMCGQEGRYVTSRHLRERLERELEHNVGLHMKPTDRPDFWSLYGRGTLHLSVLFENMRREGYEMSVGQPQVVLKDGQEPYEHAIISVPQAFSGQVIEKLSKRGAVLQRHEVDEQGIASLELTIPSRGLIGYRTEFLTDTRGEGIMHHAFDHYGPPAGIIRHRDNGAMIVQHDCETASYGLNALQERGRLMVGPGEKVYHGQVVGLHNRQNDLVVNPGRRKNLTNIRAANRDENIRLTPPVRPTLEEALELITSDELVEITPKSIRIRKQILDHNDRHRQQRAAV